MRSPFPRFLPRSLAPCDLHAEQGKKDAEQEASGTKKELEARFEQIKGQLDAAGMDLFQQSVVLVLAIAEDKKQFSGSPPPTTAQLLPWVTAF